MQSWSAQFVMVAVFELPLPCGVCADKHVSWVDELLLHHIFTMETMVILM